MKTVNHSLVKTAFVKSLPVMAGYIVLGIGFGILLNEAGFGPVWALLMSLLVFAGSMQFVGVSLISGGASVLVTAMTTLMVNARHIFYSVSMYDTYKTAGKRKPLLIFTLTDETYSLLCDGSAPAGCDPHQYRLLVSLFNYFYWVLGSFLGGLLGQIIPFDTTGIDFSMTALFVTVFVEQWTSTRESSRLAGRGRHLALSGALRAGCFSDPLHAPHYAGAGSPPSQAGRRDGS